MKASIAMATYNGGQYIKEQLQSIIKQTVLPYEIVISDDNSTDNTIEIINKFIKENSDKDIIYKVLINSSDNSGVVGNFENAIKNTTGDLIFLSDQDDIWLKNKLERIIEIFERTGTSVVFHNARILMQKKDKFEIINDTAYSHLGYFSSFNKDGIYKFENREYLSHIADNCIALGMSLCVKREFMFSCMPMSKGMNHDDWIEFCAITHNDCIAIKDILAHYRIHSSNTSGIGELNLLGNSKKLNILEKIKVMDNKAFKSIKRLCIFGKDQKNYLNNYQIKNENVNFNYDFYSTLRVNAVTKHKIPGILMLAKLYKDGWYRKQLKSIYYQDIIFVLLHTRKTRRKYINTFDSCCR